MFYPKLRNALATIIFGALILNTAQSSVRSDAMASPPPPYPFEPAEQLFYEGEFSKLLLRGVKVVELKFTASRAASSVTSDSQLQTANFLFTGEATAKGFFSKLFGLHFHYRSESTVEPKSFNVLRTLTLDEQGKRRRTSETLFDRTTNRVIWTQRNPGASAQEPSRVIESPLADKTYDLVSALYFLRTQTLAPNSQFELLISDSGRIYRVPVRVVGSKKIKSALGNVVATQIEIGVFGKDRPVEGDGQMSVWITNDKRRIPVLARIISDLGTLEITLKKATGGNAS